MPVRGERDEPEHRAPRASDFVRAELRLEVRQTKNPTHTGVPQAEVPTRRRHTRDVRAQFSWIKGVFGY
jgi:hypothetical protein